MKKITRTCMVIVTAIGLMKARMLIKGEGYLNTKINVKGNKKRVLEEMELEKIISAAEKCCLGKAACLERAVYLKRYLAKRGIPSELKIGVRKYPFRVHAWVEIDGKPFCNGEPKDEYKLIFAN